MITSINLITQNLQDMAAYYSQIADNFVSGKVKLARKQFEQLSQKQRKAYFVYIAEELKATPSDAVYSYFFELL